MSRLNGKVAAVGVGYSKIERRSHQSLASITLESCLEAIKAAGIRKEDIDGLATYPEIPVFGNANVDGIDIVTTDLMVDVLGLRGKVRWQTHTDTLVPNTFIEAVNAVGAGACDYALVFRAMHNPGGAYNAYTSSRAEGRHQWTAPYGYHRGYQYFGSAFNRYFHLYGATREHMATLILNNRRHAAMNENAYFRDSPLTRQDYLDARMLAYPVSLLDCDIPIDGGVAIVLTSAERTRDLGRPAAYVAGYGQSDMRARAMGPVLGELMENAASVADHMWESSGLSPRETKVAQLYDGYSYFVWHWLEACGFCKEGEAFQFIQDGRVALGGELPVNTFGGQLGEGRLHGMGHIAEAVRQAAGTAGERQVPGNGASVAVVGPLGAGSAAIAFTPEPV